MNLDPIVKEYSVKLNSNDKILGEYCHFKVKEFACHDGSDKVLIDNRLIAWLEYIRQLLNNTPIYINSGYRTPAYNKKIGGAKNSYHMKGQAADIRSKDFKPLEVACAARALEIPGIILYDTFVHVDTRPTRFWGINKNGVTTYVREFPMVDFKGYNKKMLGDDYDYNK